MSAIRFLDRLSSSLAGMGSVALLPPDTYLERVAMNSDDIFFCSKRRVQNAASCSALGDSGSEYLKLKVVSLFCSLTTRLTALFHRASMVLELSQYSDLSGCPVGVGH